MSRSVVATLCGLAAIVLLAVGFGWAAVVLAAIGLGLTLIENRRLKREKRRHELQSEARLRGLIGAMNEHPRGEEED